MSRFFAFTSISAFFARHLSSSRAGWICLLLAWLNKLAVAVTTTSLGGDKSLYLLLSRSLLEGHGLLEPLRFAGSSETQYFFNNAAYSPLYPVLAAPFLGLTRSPALTSMIVDGLAWGALLLALRAVGRRFLKETWIANLLLLTSGFFVFLFELGSGPKDCLATGILLWCVLLLHQVFSGEARTKTYVLLPLLLSSLALIKLLYAPLVVLLLLVLLFGSLRKERWKGTLLVAAFTAGILFLVFSRLNALKAAYPPTAIFPSEPVTTGFYPSNLLQFYPFISSSLLNTTFWSVQLSDILKTSFSSIIHSFKLLDLVLFPLLVFALFRLWRRPDMDRKIFGLLLLAALGMLSLIALAAVRTAPLDRAEGTWTYAQDARSYFVVMLVIQLIFFYLLFRTRIFPGALSRFLLLLFLIESLHGLYFTVRQLAAPVEKTGFIEGLKEKSAALQAEYHRPVAILTADKYLYFLARLEGADVHLGRLTDISRRTDSTMYLSMAIGADSLFRQLPADKRPLQLGDHGGYELHLFK